VSETTKNQELAHNVLEREFASTFINELMPGIIHNFANPLNGIMGRAKLLERRMEDYFQKIQSKYPELAVKVSDEQNKLQNDVVSICKESDRFFYMFQDLASKFYAISDRRYGHINLETLIMNEIRFLDFYLDFKHEIKKTIKPMSDLPYIYGIPSDYSYCFSALFRDSMARMKKSSRKELFLQTDYKNNMITVLLQYTGEKIVNPDDNTESNVVTSSGNFCNHLAFIQMLFKENNVNCVYEAREDMNRVTVEIPVPKEKRPSCET